MSYINHIPVQFQEGAAQAGQAISQINNVLVTDHVNMDGDALGSVGAIGCVLKTLGKNFAMFSATGVPDYLRFLDLPGPIYTDLNAVPFRLQSAIYLDCSETSRLARELENQENLSTINIDHHLCAHGLGSMVNFIDPAAAATSQLVAYVIMSMEIPLQDTLAQCVALGLMTDTGGFCHGNTTADVFALCAMLVRSGCNFSEIREKLQNNWTLQRLRLWGHIFSTAKLLYGNKLAICVVTLEDMHKFHCRQEDLEGLVEWLRKIHDVMVAGIIKEIGHAECKFSLRSCKDVDVRSIAAELGGGGHFNAAGGSIHESVERSMKILSDVIEHHLDK